MIFLTRHFVIKSWTNVQICYTRQTFRHLNVKLSQNLMNCRHFDTFHAIWMKICGYTPQTGTEHTQTNLYVQFSSKQLKKLAASAQTIATQPCRAKYRTSEVAMPTLMKIWFFLTADFLTTRLAGAKLPPQDETRSRVNIAGTSSMTTKRWWDRSGPALKFAQNVVCMLKMAAVGRRKTSSVVTCLLATGLTDGYGNDGIRWIMVLTFVFQEFVFICREWYSTAMIVFMIVYVGFNEVWLYLLWMLLWVCKIFYPNWWTETILTFQSRIRQNAKHTVVQRDIVNTFLLTNQ